MFGNNQRQRCDASGAIGLRAWGALCAAGLALFFPCISVAQEAPQAGFRFADAEGRLSLSEGRHRVLSYNYGVQKRAGVPEDRWRACYVHPLYGLDGEVLTDDFPQDHYHHRGLFWAWPHVRIGGQEYDLWMLRGIRQQFEHWTERNVGPTAAVLAVENGWYLSDRKQLREDVRFRVEPATDLGRLIDVELRLTAASEPVTLLGAEGKSYGGLSLRFAPRQETVITTANGRAAEDLNVARLTCSDLTGKFTGSTAASGVAVFARRDHPDFPPMWITRHYGFLGVGWPGTEPVVLSPGKTVTCRYRLWIHRGPTDATELQRRSDTDAAQARASSTGT